MSKAQRIETALINTANLDPADFTLDDYYGGVEVTHKKTGLKVKVPNHHYVYVLGYTMAYFFTYKHGIPALNREERSEAWCRWKGYRETSAA